MDQDQDQDQDWVSLSAFVNELAERSSVTTARRQIISCLKMGHVTAICQKFDCVLEFPDGSVERPDGYPKADFYIGPEFWMLSMSDDRSHDQVLHDMPKRLAKSRTWFPAEHWGAWHKTQPPIFGHNENVSGIALVKRVGCESYPNYGWGNVKITNTATGVYIPRNQADDILARKNRATVVKKAESREADTTGDVTLRGKQRDEAIAKFVVYALQHPDIARGAITNRMTAELLNRLVQSKTHSREWERLAKEIEAEWNNHAPDA